MIKKILVRGYIFLLLALTCCEPSNDSADKNGDRKSIQNSLPKSSDKTGKQIKLIKLGNLILDDIASINKINNMTESKYSELSIEFKKIAELKPNEAVEFLMHLITQIKLNDRIDCPRLNELLQFYILNKSEYAKSNTSANTLPLLELISTTIKVETLLEILNRASDPTLKDDLGSFLSSSLSREADIKSTMELMSKTLANDSTRLKEKMYGSYFRKDFDSTAEYLISDAISYSNTTMIKNLAITLVETNPSKGAMFILSASQANNNYEPINQFIDIWMDHNSLKATKWADSLENTKAKDAASAAIVSSLSRSKQFKEAEAWLGNIKDPELRQRTAELLERRK